MPYALCPNLSRNPAIIDIGDFYYLQIPKTIGCYKLFVHNLRARSVSRCGEHSAESIENREVSVTMNAFENLRIDKTYVTISDMGSEQDDWAKKSPEERLEGLEILRCMWGGYDQATARLSRFYSIIERTWR